jgi:hypothetical protein
MIATLSVCGQRGFVPDVLEALSCVIEDRLEVTASNPLQVRNHQYNGHTWRVTEGWACFRASADEDKPVNPRDDRDARVVVMAAIISGI